MFLDSLDIGNRALQHCGAEPIASISEDSKNNLQISFAYDKVRRAELRRNVWRFAVRKVLLRPIDTTTLLLDPTLYSSTTTYLPGAVVRDANDQHWISLKPDNLNQTPGGNNEFWDAYFGPLTVSLFSSNTTYWAGELVYKAGAGPGSYQVFMSLKNGNADVPDVTTAWDSATTYYADQVVNYSGSQWRSLLPFNLGITPADGPNDWSAVTSYSIADQVTGSNHKIYVSVTNSNVGNDPTTDNGTNWTDTGTYSAWSRSPMLTPSATSWRPLGSTALKALTILYPVGSGPSSDQTTRNVFYLPAGYLRKAPRDSKAGSTSYLGAPSNLPYEDWEFESSFIVSSQIEPMILSFVADISIVRTMDDMFCEGLACRIALVVCEPITQSTVKLQSIASEYERFMGEARKVNAIEQGATELPLDDYLACRV